MTDKTTPGSAALDIRYRRLGGAGVARPLWECVLCGSAISDKEAHDRWHLLAKR